MQQQWNLKTRGHECARTSRPFETGEVFHTAIYFDTESGDFVRRDVSSGAWEEEIAERTPLASWRAAYEPPDSVKPKAEIASRENAESILRRLIEEDEANTEQARYILALMLERKKHIVPKEIQETERGRMIIYEHKKSGEVYIIRDPELRLDEIDSMQEEVAMLLGFGGPAAAAAAAAGMRFTPDGKLIPNPESTEAKSGRRGRRGAKQTPDEEAAPLPVPDAVSGTEGHGEPAVETASVDLAPEQAASADQSSSPESLDSTEPKEL